MSQRHSKLFALLLFVPYVGFHLPVDRIQQPTSWRLDVVAEHLGYELEAAPSWSISHKHQPVFSWGKRKSENVFGCVWPDAKRIDYTIKKSTH